MDANETAARYWTANELAAAVNVTRRAVLYMLKAGKIRGEQLANRQWIIADADARNWLQSRQCLKEP